VFPRETIIIVSNLETNSICLGDSMDWIWIAILVFIVLKVVANNGSWIDVFDTNANYHNAWTHFKYVVFLSSLTVAFIGLVVWFFIH
jgi:hypothetical protein